MNEKENTSSRKIRVALFGAGKMAMHHAMAIKLQGNANLVAVADPALSNGERPMMPDNDVGKENFTRAVGDAVRAHCIMGNCKKSYIEKICKWKIDTYSKIGKYYEKRGEKK